MNISSISSVSFKGYVPVRYMAKNDETGKYNPVIDKDNLRKCHSIIIRNLNGTAKTSRNDKFVKFYASYDKDYKNNPIAHSVYDKNSPTVYLVTGNDCDVVEKFAKPVGKAKSEAMNMIGNPHSYEASLASTTYFRNVEAFLNGSCKRLKSDNGNKLSLVVYMNPLYTKNGKLKKFELVNAKFFES